MTDHELTDGNWDYLLTLLPADWQGLAKTSGGVRRLRGATSLSSLLRTLLLHIAHGCSLRTTSAVAKAAGWASMSDVALLKKLRACEDWLRELCAGLLKDSGMSLPPTHRGLRMRLVDSTIIKQPGATGSQWRVLYSLRVPDWQCDGFRLTAAKGAGNGESLKYFTIKRGDCLLADRGFSQLAGIEQVAPRRQRHRAAQRSEHTAGTRRRQPGGVARLAQTPRQTRASRLPARLAACAKRNPATHPRAALRCAQKHRGQHAGRAQTQATCRAQTNRTARSDP